MHLRWKFLKKQWRVLKQRREVAQTEELLLPQRTELMARNSVRLQHVHWDGAQAVTAGWERTQRSKHPLEERRQDLVSASCGQEGATSLRRTSAGGPDALLHRLTLRVPQTQTI